MFSFLHKQTVNKKLNDIHQKISNLFLFRKEGQGLFENWVYETISKPLNLNGHSIPNKYMGITELHKHTHTHIRANLHVMKFSNKHRVLSTTDLPFFLPAKIWILRPTNPTSSLTTWA